MRKIKWRFFQLHPLLTASAGDSSSSHPLLTASAGDSSSSILSLQLQLEILLAVLHPLLTASAGDSSSCPSSQPYSYSWRFFQLSFILSLQLQLEILLAVLHPNLTASAGDSSSCPSSPPYSFSWRFFQLSFIPTLQLQLEILQTSTLTSFSFELGVLILKLRLAGKLKVIVSRHWEHIFKISLIACSI